MSKNVGILRRLFTTSKHHSNCTNNPRKPNNNPVNQEKDNVEIARVTFRKVMHVEKGLKHPMRLMTRLMIILEWWLEKWMIQGESSNMR